MASTEVGVGNYSGRLFRLGPRPKFHRESWFRRDCGAGLRYVEVNKDGAGVSWCWAMLAAMSDPRPLVDLTPAQLSALVRSTVSHYEQRAEAFRAGTQDHDVSQNVDALLRYLPGPAPQRILDLGCGPGRDLSTFVARGHAPVGLDGAAAFVAMARAGGFEVWHQDLLALDLPAARFDGIFANAVLFHVPTQELGRVLRELHRTLVTGGVLMCSNPRGPDIERVQGLRFGSYLTLETWSSFVTTAGFELIEHYFRPPGRPREEQPWLATVWRAL